MKNKQEKPSIAESVRNILDNDPVLMECLEEDVINYTWLSEKIIDKIRILSGKEKISLDAVKAAIIRYQLEIKKKDRKEHLVPKVIAKSTIEMQDDIVVITINKHAIEKIIKELLEIGHNARFFNLTQGKKTYTIVISEEDVANILDKIDKKEIRDLVKNQSAILMLSPYDIMTTPGVINQVTRLLYRQGINITQIISCYTDTILLINKNDSIKAYKALRDAIETSRTIYTK